MALTAPVPAPTDLDVTRHRMLLVRRFEERCVELYSMTKILGFLHLYIGEEAVAIGVMSALEPIDAVVSAYREHDHTLARGVDAASVAEGEFHECLDLATLWRLPIVFCCENDLYPTGTSTDRAHATPDLTAEAASYGVAAQTVDGMDVLAVARAARTAVDTARAGAGPYLLDLRTYRFRAHPMDDRDRAEIAQWRTRNPLDTFPAWLRSHGVLTDDDLRELETLVRNEIEPARGPRSGPSSLPGPASRS